MKLLYSLIFSLSCVVIQAQVSDTSIGNNQFKYEQLLKQGNKQFKTGSILLATGYASATLGFFTALKYGYIMDDWPTASTALFVAGTAAVASGWYLFISGAIKKKIAKTQLKLRTSIIKFGNKSYIPQPSIEITFRL